MLSQPSLSRPSTGGEGGVGPESKRRPGARSGRKRGRGRRGKSMFIQGNPLLYKETPYYTRKSLIIQGHPLSYKERGASTGLGPQGHEGPALRLNPLHGDAVPSAPHPASPWALLLLLILSCFVICGFINININTLRPLGQRSLPSGPREGSEFPFAC